ncbi:MAG: hypothetical protein JXO44_06785 [Clostridia bacterium]|nr:hypothetical protein [Clostridia bacterium]
MIKIIPVEHKMTFDAFKSDFFKGQEHYYRMEMQDGAQVLGVGDVFVKGEAAYLLALEILDQSMAAVIFDSLIRSLMNLASHHGAVVFSANEIYPLMSYFTKRDFSVIDKFTRFEDAEAFTYYVNIESFFARPCKG